MDIFMNDNRKKWTINDCSMWHFQHEEYQSHFLLFADLVSVVLPILKMSATTCSMAMTWTNVMLLWFWWVSRARPIHRVKVSRFFYFIKFSKCLPTSRHLDKWHWNIDISTDCNFVYLFIYSLGRSFVGIEPRRQYSIVQWNFVAAFEWRWKCQQQQH